jgi:serine/threonine protein kinase
MAHMDQWDRQTERDAMSDTEHEQAGAAEDDSGCSACGLMAQLSKARNERARRVGMTHEEILRVALKMAENVDVRDRKKLLKKYPKCFVGGEAVRWLVRTGHVTGEEQAVTLGQVMGDNGLIAHFSGATPFGNNDKFYIFTGPCAPMVGGGPGAGCRAFSAAERAIAAAAAAEVACNSTPGCRLLRFLHEHDIDHFYDKLFTLGKLDYNDVMLAFTQTEAGAIQLFCPLGLSQSDVDQLRNAVSESIDRRLSKLGHKSRSTSSVRSSTSDTSGSEHNSISSKGSVTRNRMLSSNGSGTSSDAVRAQLSFDAQDGPAIRSWAITDPSEVTRETYIAEGTSGKVWKGQWQGMAVAVKVFKANALEHEIATNEIQLMRRMQHQYLLRLYGAYMAPPSFIIVAELCVGSLSSLLYGRHSNAVDRLTPKWELVFSRGIATGMAFLHQHNVAHRDLKSSNILFDKTMMPKICDFAFSKHSDRGASEEEMAKRVQFSSSVGTPQWMAPEVLRGEAYTLSADVWSFGVVLWEILARCAPYRGLTSYAVTYKVSTEALCPVPAEQWPKMWSQLMQDCWAQESARRPAFATIVARLAKFVLASGPAGKIARLGLDGPPSPRRLPTGVVRAPKGRVAISAVTPTEKIADVLSAGQLLYADRGVGGDHQTSSEPELKPQAWQNTVEPQSPAAQFARGKTAAAQVQHSGSDEA